METTGELSLGQIVSSKAGRDKDKLFAVIQILDDSYVMIADGDLSALGYDNISGPLFPKTGAGAVPPMILPTSRKQFFFQTNIGKEWGSFWNRLWSAARKAVRTSDRVVVCGYGLFPIDRRGRNLLLNGELPGAIEVCSGSRTDSIVAELRARGRNANAAEHLYFEDWVNSQ